MDIIFSLSLLKFISATSGIKPPTSAAAGCPVESKESSLDRFRIFYKRLVEERPFIVELPLDLVSALSLKIRCDRTISRVLLCDC
jgi:hypothetical protein